MSRSREISCDQLPLLDGRDEVPVSLTWRKQPLAVVQAGSPNSLRYVARSAAASGSLYASTMATVAVEEALDAVNRL